MKVNRYSAVKKNREKIAFLKADFKKEKELIAELRMQSTIGKRKWQPVNARKFDHDTSVCTALHPSM